MHKLINLITLVILGVLLVACSSNEETKSTENTGSSNSGSIEKFTFASSGLYPPFNYNDGSELTGFDIEIGKALAEEMGMEADPVTNPWQTIIAALQADKFDAILGSMAITEERKKEVLFSDAYYESGAQIFVKEGNTEITSEADLTGKKIGVVVSSTFEEMARKYTDKVTTYDSDVTALQDLLVEGRLDAVITDQLVGMYAINQNDLKISAVGEPIYLDQMGIAIKTENTELLDKVNAALAKIKENGVYAEISEKYFGEDISK